MAIDILLRIGRFLQQVFEEGSLFCRLFDMTHSKESTTESTHQFRFVATTYLSLREQFEGTYHCIIAHSTALHDDMTAQFLGVLQLQYLVQAISNHRISQAS